MGAPRPTPLIAPDRPPPRYSTRPLPPYRHVPGLTPHPVKHPAGHLYGIEEGPAAGACRRLPETWADCQEYLYGVDLFNRAFLWEAHEAWELVWIAAGKTTEAAGFMQSLIQVAAALLRSHLETPRGARNLLAKADRRLAPLAARLRRQASQRYLGIDLDPWRRTVDAYLAGDRAEYPFLVLAGLRAREPA